MDYFLDKYDYSLDDKNRINIPAKYRKALAQMQQKTIVISCLEESRLTLYPNAIFKEKIVARLNDLPQMDEDANEIRRAVGRDTTEVQLDSQGRIMIPGYFLEQAGIKKKVQILGLVNKIELWNPDTYQEFDKRRDAELIKAELKKFRI